MRLRKLTKLEQFQYNRPRNLSVPYLPSQLSDRFARLLLLVVLLGFEIFELAVYDIVLDLNAGEQVVEGIVPAGLRELWKLLRETFLAEVGPVLGLLLLWRLVNARGLRTELHHPVPVTYLVVHYLYFVVVIVVNRSEYETWLVVGTQHYRHLCHAVQGHHNLGVHEHQAAL